MGDTSLKEKTIFIQVLKKYYEKADVRCIIVGRGSCDHSTGPSGSTTDGEFTDWHNYLPREALFRRVK